MYLDEEQKKALIDRIGEEQAAFFNKSLPKWPQLIIRGKELTAEQAEDIIFKTDSFFTCTIGNNHKWVKWARDELGLSTLWPESNEGEEEWTKDWGTLYTTRQKFFDAIGFVNTEYISNSWLSSCFIFGPHGWCHPNGKISYSDNIGKWPSVEEVYIEFETIAEKWPFLEMTARLMDREECEFGGNEVVGFEIANGKVKMVVHAHPLFDDIAGDNRDLSSAISLISRDPYYYAQVGVPTSREQGLPNSTVVRIGKIYKPIAEQLVAEAIAQEKKDVLEFNSGANCSPD